MTEKIVLMKRGDEYKISLVDEDFKSEGIINTWADNSHLNEILRMCNLLCIRERYMEIPEFSRDKLIWYLGKADIEEDIKSLKTEEDLSLYHNRFLEQLVGENYRVLYFINSLGIVRVIDSKYIAYGAVRLREDYYISIDDLAAIFPLSPFFRNYGIINSTPEEFFTTLPDECKELKSKMEEIINLREKGKQHLETLKLVYKDSDGAIYEKKSTEEPGRIYNNGLYMSSGDKLSYHYNFRHIIDKPDFLKLFRVAMYNNPQIRQNFQEQLIRYSTAGEREGREIEDPILQFMLEEIYPTMVVKQENCWEKFLRMISS